MSRHIEAWCDRQVEGVKVKELPSAAWSKDLCAGCWQKGNCARWSWEGCLESERQAAREELAKHPWRPVTYENLWKVAFGLWCLEHPLLKSTIAYSENEIIERQDRIAADYAETRELYRSGDITERGRILDAGGEKYCV